MKRARVASGVRRQQALAFIRQQEKASALWGAKDLADALGVSVQQAWSLLQSLTFSGELARGPRTVVLEDALKTVSQ